MKVIFLHCPKTAGQSIRKMLDEAFGLHNICPARSNEDLLTYSIDELNRFSVIAPHGDWSLLDSVGGDKYVFSVFRNPMDRILSFYFFLLKKAQSMPDSKRKLAEHQGLNAIFTRSPDDYFFAETPHLKAFIDDNYDNFYTYYFAGRTLDGRRKISNLIRRGMITREKVLQNAIANIHRLDGVFTINQIDRIRSTIETISGTRLAGIYQENANPEISPDARRQKLKALGASNKVFDYLDNCCALDNRLWEHIQSITT